MKFSNICGYKNLIVIVDMTQTGRISPSNISSPGTNNNVLLNHSNNNNIANSYFNVNRPVLPVNDNFSFQRSASLFAFRPINFNY